MSRPAPQIKGKKLLPWLAVGCLAFTALFLILTMLAGEWLGAWMRSRGGG